MRDTSALSSDPRRRLLLDLYAAACAAVDGRRVVRAALAAQERHGASRDWTLIAVGKAAGAMALGALDVLGPLVKRGLVVTRPGHLDPDFKRWPSVSCRARDHPLPGPASLAAGAQLARFAAATPPGQRVLV